MVIGFNHIGIVVRNIDETIKKMRDGFDVREESRTVLENMGQISAMVRIGDQLLEIMEPLGDTGSVPKFYAEKGEGFHHISLHVTDFEEDIAKFEAAGYRIIGKMKMGKHNIAFIHPKSANGLLYEIAD